MLNPILVAVDPRREDREPLALGLRLARLARAPLLLAATFPFEDGLVDAFGPTTFACTTSTRRRQLTGL
jgi:hypothetical protein